MIIAFTGCPCFAGRRITFKMMTCVRTWPIACECVLPYYHGTGRLGRLSLSRLHSADDDYTVVPRYRTERSFRVAASQI